MLYSRTNQKRCLMYWGEPQLTYVIYFKSRSVYQLIYYGTVKRIKQLAKTVHQIKATQWWNKTDMCMCKQEISPCGNHSSLVVCHLSVFFIHSVKSHWYNSYLCVHSFNASMMTHKWLSICRVGASTQEDCRCYHTKGYDHVLRIPTCPLYHKPLHCPENGPYLLNTSFPQLPFLAEKGTFSLKYWSLSCLWSGECILCLLTKTSK